MKILIVTGSSGGHIFPALSFLDRLKDREKGIDALLVLPKTSRKGFILSDNYKVKYLSISPIGFSLNFSNLIAVLRLFKGSLESVFIMFEFRPDIVIGFGTIDCLPLLLLAWIFRVKTLIHEQNVLPGRANRLLARFSDRIAISFEETREHLAAYEKKIVLTGNPIRKELEKIDRLKALGFFGFKEDKFTILVMGGSLGSQRINAAFLKAASLLTDTSGLQVIHITGIKDCELIKARYKDLNIESRVFGFLNSMQYAYSACDLVISRAGATSVTEIMFFGLPAILIPYPYAYKHQLNNARLLGRKGCAFIIKDEELDENILRDRIELLMNNQGELKKMHSGYPPGFKNNAADLLVKEAVSLNYN